MVSWRRGVEPVIVAIILIAIAIVVAVATVGWILGLWRTQETEGIPRISAESPVLCTGRGVAVAAVYIRNTGTGSDRVAEIYLDYGGHTYRGSPAGWNFGNETSAVIPAGLAGWLYIKFDLGGKAISVGEQATIRITFERSGTVKMSVRALDCESLSGFRT